MDSQELASAEAVNIFIFNQTRSWWIIIDLLLFVYLYPQLAANAGKYFPAHFSEA